MKLELISSNSPVYPGTKTFLAKIDYSPNLKKLIHINNTKFFLKDEFHLTLLGNENGKYLFDFLKQNLKYSQDEIKNFYNELENETINLLDSSNFKFLKEFHFLQKEYNHKKFEIRNSIVQIIKTDLLEKFYNLLKQKGISIKFDSPTPHITLYKQKENTGIGLNKKEDLKKYSIKKFNNIS
jgi:hypothetical protein